MAATVRTFPDETTYQDLIERTLSKNSKVHFKVLNHMAAVVVWKKMQLILFSIWKGKKRDLRKLWWENIFETAKRFQIFCIISIKCISHFFLNSKFLISSFCIESRLWVGKKFMSHFHVQMDPTLWIVKLSGSKNPFFSRSHWIFVFWWKKNISSFVLQKKLLFMGRKLSARLTD